MGLTIAQAAERSGLSAHTLRYYDKEGLLPFVERNEAGIRIFKESDFGALKTISCLKKTGMPIKDIRRFLQWAQEGDSTLEKRLEFFLAHKKVVEEKMAELQTCMERIDYKIDLYQTSIKRDAAPASGPRLQAAGE